MSKTVLIEYTKPSLYRCGDFRIIAGMNEVRAEVWEAVKDNVGVKSRVASGDIVFRSPVKPAPIAAPKKELKQEPKEFSILDLSLREAKELIGKTVDYKTLIEWKKVETRKGVLSAIEKQLTEFAGVPEGEAVDSND